MMGFWSAVKGLALPGVAAVERSEELWGKQGSQMQQPRVSQPTQARASQHCCFYCRWCAAVVPLPHDRLGLMFAGPAIRRINMRSLATVCNSCNHVATYSLFRGAKGYDTRHKLAATQPVGATVLVDWLRCEEKSCPYPLPLFVCSEPEVTRENLRETARPWEWDEVTCASGHPILRPLWLYEKRPLEFPAQLK
jgi:hypothetical protein